MSGVVILKPGRETALLRRHPWIFSGAIDRVTGDPQPGSVVIVRDAKGQFMAWGAYSPQSSIRVRVWSFDEEDTIDEAFIHNRLKDALALRGAMPSLRDTNACRLVNAESDGLPGLVVDRFNDVLVLQSLSQSSEFWKDAIKASLSELTGIHDLYERSDDDVRGLEGLPPLSRWLTGGADRDGTTIHEDGLAYRVNFATGHKTGFYLDLRDIRRELGRYVKDRNVLNCFCYSGSFSIVAGKHEAASVTSVDSSAAALELARENERLNGLSGLDWLEADVFRFLRDQRDRGSSYDLIILDPPKFAPTAMQVEKATRAYKDINLLALKLLTPGGLLLTLSCSGGVSLDLFQKIVAGAALDAGREAVILRTLHQAEDHPVNLAFPEAAYLKGLICSV